MASPLEDSIAALGPFFEYAHLPPALQTISYPFGELARLIAAGPQNEQTLRALHKLLESKDCAVRAQLKPRAVAPSPA